MATSPAKTFADELDAIAARYESQFAGQSRGSRNLDELDALIKDTKGVLSRIESIPSSVRGADLSAIGETAKANVDIYTRERALIVEAKSFGPAFEEFAPLAAGANLVFARYHRHFAGQSRGTRDPGLLGELIEELKSLDESMADVLKGGTAERMKADHNVVRETLKMYQGEEKEIRKAHVEGTVDDRVNRFAQLANAQFKIYADHFAGRSRMTRRPALLVRVIASLERIQKDMKGLDAKVAGDVNKKNLEIVATQLATYKAELIEVRKARQGTPFGDLMGMLGGAANELFEEYRAGFAGQDRKSRDLALLTRICDDLGDLRRQMLDLAKADENPMNEGNLQIVTSQLSQFEEEYEAIETAKK